MHRTIAFVVLASVAGAAHGQATELRRCVGPKGAVSYTQDLCPKGWKLHHSFYTAPEPPPTADELRRRDYLRRKGEADSRYLQSLAGTGPGARGHSISTSTSGFACSSAKANRDAVLSAVGLNRTVDLLRSLDEQVYAACK